MIRNGILRTGIGALFLFASAAAQVSAEVLEGSRDFGLTENITVHVSIDTDSGIVTIEMTGPAGIWWGVGFGGTVMASTYAIVALEDDSTVREYVLGASSGGTQQSLQQISVSSDTISSGTRTIILTRPIVGEEYNFPTSSTEIDVIAGYGVVGFAYASSSFMGGYSEPDEGTGEDPTVFVKAKMCFVIVTPDLEPIGVCR